jgi:two-component system, LytTR family, response regulator
MNPQLIRTIIVDDEAHNVENIKSIMASHHPEVAVVSTAASADEGISEIVKHHPDLVFLDIQMPEKSGFDMLMAFPEITFEIIFITAYDHYGIRAIKFSALDYLLKPVDLAELKKAINKARVKIASKLHNKKIENLLDYIKTGQKGFPKIALPTQHEIRYVRVDEIIRCEASNNYTTFFTQSDEEILVCKTLKDFAELLLPYGFKRTHQSHLANLHYVKSYLREDGGALLMQDGSKVPISRQNREIVKDALNSNL